jgi:hypothetical protein
LEVTAPGRVLNVLNLGAGVQSTTLYLMSLRQDEPDYVPRFDAAIFADTQDEPRAVYEHLDWLRSLGGPPILVRTRGKLSEGLIHGFKGWGRKFAQIPAFAMRPGAVREGQMRRQCTAIYKVEVVERAIRRDVLGLAHGRHVPGDVRVVQYLGLSFDEPGRIIRVRARFQAVSWSEPRFPLFDLELTRRGCLAYLGLAAPGRTVPRSACVFCPYRTNDEWRRMRDEDPESFADACRLDDALRAGASCTQGLDSHLFIHRSCRPLCVAPIDTPESRGEQYTFGFAQECEGMCGV